MRHTAIDKAYDCSELQTIFAMTGIMRPVSKLAIRKPVTQKRSMWFRVWSPVANSFVLWRKRRKQGSSCRASLKALHGIASGSKIKMRNQNPQRAASPLMPHRPAGRRAPAVSAQQTWFVVLDQMGARHRAALCGDPLTSALKQAQQQADNGRAGTGDELVFGRGCGY